MAAGEADDVFEIIDFTNASEWESLVADVEKAIRRWGLEMGSADDVVALAGTARDAGVVNTGALQMRGRQYRLSHVRVASPGGDAARVTSQSRQFKEIAAAFKASGMEAPPQWTTPALSTAHDFAASGSTSTPVHPVTAWFGITDFLVVNPADSRYSARISPSEAQMVASALAVAVATTRCAIPAFTQLDTGVHTNYRGCAVAAGMHTAFTSASTASVPRAYANLSGLLTLFRSKLPGVDRRERVAIGAKFTYTLPNWFDDWMPPPPPTASTDIYGVPPQKALPVGAFTDPLAGVRLFAVWPAFRENAVQDHAAYSELDPKVAPSWAIQARGHPQTKGGLLTETVRAFGVLLECRHSWADLRDGDDAMAGEAESPDADDGLRQNVLDRLQGNRGYEGKAGRLVGTATTALRKTLEKVETVADAARRRTRRTGFDGPSLSESDLDRLIWPRLFGADDWDATIPPPKSKVGEMKGCPPHSLLAELSTTMAVAMAHGGGVQAAATLWDEVIEDIEFNYWQDLLAIPRVATVVSPDMRHCIAHQKLEMINCCIRKQKARNELLRRQGHKASKRRPGRPSSEDRDLSDSDDEFHSADEGTGSSVDDAPQLYLAPDLEASLLEHPDGAAAAAPATGDAAARVGDDTAEGVAEVRNDLTLLGTAIPLNVPVTQNEGPMTEDMMEQKLADLTEMGTSKEAIEARVQMQSMSLRSDMSAFKAANPTCCLEDFVRWHSPRDFEDDGEGGGRLSERMREPANLWQQMWRDSEPCPVARQHTIFNATKEALAAIKYLRTTPPAVISRQLLPSLIVSAEAALSRKASTLLQGAAEPMQAEVARIRMAAAGMGTGSIEEDLQRLDTVLHRIGAVETMLGTAESLLSRLGTEIDIEVIARLAVGESVPLLGDTQREAIRHLFFGDDEGAATVDAREFVLRLVTRFPAKSSRPGLNRMYAHVSDSDFTVAGMFTEDKAFDL